MTKVTLSIIIALAIVGVSIFLKYKNLETIEADQSYERANVSDIQPGTEHTHMTIAIFVEDSPLPLNSPVYAELDDAVHFHGNEGAIIHKHAKGITLSYFLKTLDITITPSCLTFSGQSYCTNSSKRLDIFINKELINDKVSTYELKQGDKILVNYGNDDEITLGLKFNSVPNLPEDLTRPLENQNEI